MNDKAFIVGIVGKVGSGKSTVALLLEKDYQFIRLDVDQLGHHALDNKKEELFQEFGSGIKGADSGIDRRKLGRIVFSDERKLLRLNSIVHPEIKKKAIEFIQQHPHRMIAVDAALLFEIGLDELCDFIIAVDAPDSDIINRVREYRGWDDTRIKNVLKAQEYLKFLKEKSDYIIFNNGDLQKLHKQVEFFVHVIL